MGDNKKEYFKLLRYLCLGIIIIFGSITIISSGGGGGGGDDDDNGDNNDNGGSNILSPQVYNFNFNFIDTNPLRFEAAADGSAITVTLTAFSEAGTYNVSAGETTTTNGNITVDTGELYGIININTINSVIKWTGTGYPTEGSFYITGEGGALIYEIRINSVGGVDLIWEDDTYSFTWQEFLDVADDEAEPETQRIASLAYQLWEMAMKRTWYFLQAFKTILEQQDALETAGSNQIGFTETCDQFPPTGGTSGARNFKYIDNDSNGEVGPGDDFQVAFNSSTNGCWYDDPGDDIDLLVKGTIEMSGYLETTENDELTALGFDSVEFIDFTDTETTGTYEVTTTDVIETNGAFGIFITPGD